MNQVDLLRNKLKQKKKLRSTSSSVSSSRSRSRQNDEILTKKQLQSLSEFLSYDLKDELEVSFGSFNMSKDGQNYYYNSNITIFSYNLVKNFFIDNNFKKAKSHTVVKSVNNYPYRKIRDIESETAVVQYKNRLLSDIDNVEYGFRIKLSKEEFSDNIDFDKIWEDNIKLRDKGHHKKLLVTVREKQRTTFTTDDPSSIFYGFNFDLTVVNQVKVYTGDKNPDIYSKLYEFEIERIDNIDRDAVISVVKKLLEVMNMSNDFLYILKKKNRDDVMTVYKDFMNNHSVKFQYNTKGLWNKPVNIKEYHLMKKGFNPYVTIKINGVRFMLFIYQNYTYLVSFPEIILIGINSDTTFSGTILDCEYISMNNVSRIYAFDLLFYKGDDYRNESFSQRYDKLLTTVNSQSSSSLVSSSFSKLEAKEYYNIGNFYDKTRMAFSDMDKYITLFKVDKKREIIDGLIIQKDVKYKNDETFKWKPLNMMTIDFLFSKRSPEDLLDEDEDINNTFFFDLLTKSFSSHNTYDLFTGTKKFPFPGYIKTNSQTFEDYNLDKTIVECYYDDKFDTFIPVKIRDDRPSPNYTSTASDVWEDIKDIKKYVDSTTIQGANLRIMRKYHNKFKKTMLIKYLKSTQNIVDGSGRGGDLDKWQQLKLNKVFAIDPNNENLNELRRRHNSKNFVFELDIINDGAENTLKINEHVKNLRIDGISAFFSLTFFFKDENMLDNLVNTLSIIKNGYFMGIVLDGDAVKTLMENNEGNYDDKVFSIRYVNDKDNGTPYGHKIITNIYDNTSMVKDVIEYLFFFDIFKKKMESAGFKLTHNEFLNSGEYYDILPSESQVFSSLNRSFVFTKKSEDNIEDNIEEDIEDNIEKEKNIEDNIEKDIEDNIEKDIEDNIEEIEDNIEKNIEKDIVKEKNNEEDNIVDLGEIDFYISLDQEMSEGCNEILVRNNIKFLSLNMMESYLDLQGFKYGNIGDSGSLYEYISKMMKLNDEILIDSVESLNNENIKNNKIPQLNIVLSKLKETDPLGFIKNFIKRKIKEKQYNEIYNYMLPLLFMKNLYIMKMENGKSVGVKKYIYDSNEEDNIVILDFGNNKYNHVVHNSGNSNFISSDNENFEKYVECINNLSPGRQIY